MIVRVSDKMAYKSSQVMKLSRLRVVSILIEIVDVTKSAKGTSDIFEKKYKDLVENYDVLIKMIEEYKKVSNRSY